MDYATVADVRAALGLDPADTGDDQWLTDVTAAANVVAGRRRLAAGYHDDDALGPPDVAAVRQGTVLYAVALYRERGAVDGYASMAELGSFIPTGGSWGQIQRLWGTGRPVAV